MSQFDLIATAAFGLEKVVARELEGLGYAPKVVGSGQVWFQGDLTAICRANLWLRTSDRVLIRMGTFPATDFGQLFDQTHALPWEEWISKGATFPVNGKSHKSQLSSVPACQKIVKKAIVEKLKKSHGGDWLAETGPKYSVEIAMLNDQAILTLDTTGPSLHKRGYRKLTTTAPIKETLAAAMVLLSRWTLERPFIDPFCGSGTIPIEAAMIGRNLAPGRDRDFPSELWPQISADVWAAAHEEVRDLERRDVEMRVMGTDIDEEVLSLARYHSKVAGVEEQVHLQQRDFAELSSKKDYGCLVTNPPYGRRLGEYDDTAELYETFPNVLRRLTTWSHFILTARHDFENLVGQEASRRRKLYNGRIQCTLFQYFGPKPGKPQQGDKEPSTFDSASPGKRKIPAVPAFGGNSEKALEQAELFRSRLTKRARHLRRWPTKQGITCFRLYERDIPEIPLVVDRYEDWLHVAEFERPHERSPAQHGDWLDLMVRTAGEVLDVHPSKIFTKYRARQRGLSQYERRGADSPEVVVQEGGLKFKVNLAEYVDTGLFLDHRITRSMVRDACAGKRILNLFAYTGSFTVYAAAGGASETTTIDLSNTYQAWSQENMSLNGFTGGEHYYHAMDVLEFLRAHPPGESYDVVVVDPPTFSNSKKTDQVWDIQKDHVELFELLLPLVAKGGVIYFSTNFRRFKWTATLPEGFTVREISKQTVPDDFRNQRIHRCWLIRNTGERPQSDA